MACTPSRDAGGLGPSPELVHGATVSGSMRLEPDRDGGISRDSGISRDGGISPWRPPPRTSWQWQLTGTIDTSFDVSMYDIDLFDAPQSTIDQLRAQGRVVICYFSAGTYENWRPDASSFPSSTLGQSNGWPGERWLDVRDARVKTVMRQRLDQAASKHCDGVEPDNVDGYANSTGFSLTASDQLDYNRFLAMEAHARNLSVGLKNDVDQVTSLVGDFEWALDEECIQFQECSRLAPFINAGKAVFHVEYSDVATAASVCPQTAPLQFSTLIKHRSPVDAFRIACP